MEKEIKEAILLVSEGDRGAAGDVCWIFCGLTNARQILHISIELNGRHERTISLWF
jgi:hypothetical protein